MGGMSRRELLARSALLASGIALSGGIAISGEFEDDGPGKGPGKIPGIGPGNIQKEYVDSSKFFCSFQQESDKSHFHFGGYMQCFGNECAKNGEAPYSGGCFSKTYWRNSPDGVPRFANMKGSRAPSEFFSVQGNNIFLEEEVMTWDPTSNNEYRDHHDKHGSPNHLWGKTNDLPSTFVSPNIGDFYWRYCDKSKPDEFIDFHDGGYTILGPYDLSLTSIGDLENLLVPYGIGIDRQWPVLNLAFGKPDATVELLIRVNYWAPFGDRRRGTPSDWAYQECYYYGALRTDDAREGLGLLRWNVGSHEHPVLPLFIWKQSTLNKVIWEPDDNHLIALNLCEQLPRSNIVLAQPTAKWGEKQAFDIARNLQRR